MKRFRGGLARTVAAFAASGLLLAAAVAAQFLLRSRRRAGAPAVSEGVFAAIGGFRSIAAEVIWFRADRLQEEGRYVELAQLANALALMEPHTPEVWSYAAWNLSYNISVMMPDPEGRWRWVRAGLELLRDRGLVMNPCAAELYRDLAWLFELKLGANIDAAAGTYRRKWSEIVSDVERRGAWAELRMDPVMMKAIESATGFTDWKDPRLSAIYWAVSGLPYATGADASMLRAIARQSRVLYEKAH